MKIYSQLASTFIISAILLFIGNKLYEAIKSIGLTTSYYLSFNEKITYGAGFVFFIAGLVCIFFAIREYKLHK